MDGEKRKPRVGFADEAREKAAETRPPSPLEPRDHSLHIATQQDSWLGDEDFESSQRKERRDPRVRNVMGFLRRRRHKVALFVMGVGLILAGALSYKIELGAKQTKYFYRAMYFLAAVCISGIFADILMILVQKALEYFYSKTSADQNLEYTFHSITYYFSIVRNSASRLVWSILVIIAFSVAVPRRPDNSVESNWELPFYHLIRILGIVALLLASRIVSKVLRQWLAQDFGARSFRPRILESFGHEQTIALLRGRGRSPLFKTLYRNARAVAATDASNPELWQTFMHYVVSHHVDSAEPSTGRHSLRKYGCSASLSRRARPTAIQIFARILARLEARSLFRAEEEAEDQRHRDSSRAPDPASFSLEVSEEQSSLGAMATGMPLSGGVSNNAAIAEGAIAEELTDDDEAEETSFKLSQRTQMPKQHPTEDEGNCASAEDAAADPASHHGPAGEWTVSSRTVSTSGSSRSRQGHLFRQGGITKLVREKDTVMMSDADLAEDTHLLMKMVKKASADLDSTRKSPEGVPTLQEMAPSSASGSTSGTGPGAASTRFIRIGRGKSRASPASGAVLASSLSSASMATRIISKDDFIDAFTLNSADTREQWEKIWKDHLDPENTGFITWQRFRKRLLDMFEFRVNLALTILDAQTVIKSMDGLIMCGLLVFVLVIGLTMYSSDFVSLLASFGTMLVGYSFIFGSSVQESFDNVIFLFGMHPYDVGDVVLIDDRRFKVGRIRLLTTDFVRNDGSFIRRSNRTLRDLALINLSTSEKHCQDFSTLLPVVDVTQHFMQTLQTRLNELVAHNPDMFLSISCFVNQLIHPLDASGELTARGTHPTHSRILFWVSFAATLEEIARISSARTTFLLYVGEILRELGVAKPLIADTARATRERGDSSSDSESDSGAAAAHERTARGDGHVEPEI